jgi:hypothetical protein
MDYLPEDYEYRQLPDAGNAEYLLNHLMSVGICSSGTHSQTPLTWLELKSYNELSGANLDSWECETLIELSRAYVSTLSAARQPDMPPPYVPDDVDVEEISRKEEAARMKKAFGL